MSDGFTLVFGSFLMAIIFAYLGGSGWAILLWLGGLLLVCAYADEYVAGPANDAVRRRNRRR